MFIYDGRIFIVNDTVSSKEVSRVRDVIIDKSTRKLVTNERHACAIQVRFNI